MSLDPYNQEVRERFMHPEHAGELCNAITSRVDTQDVRVRLSATCDGGDMLQLRFQAYGCPHVIAACELFCSACEGRPVSELNGFTAADIMRKLSVPVEKTGRILVLEDAIRSLARNISDQDASKTT